MATSAEWSLGYARQADADFCTFQLLQASTVPECHRLQFLQMACEKLVKAHLCGTGMDSATMQSSHACVSKILPIVLRQQAVFVNLQGGKVQELMKHARLLSQEIEILAPAVKRGNQRPDNCEYPWEDHGALLHVPLDWTFTPSQLVVMPDGRTILKLIRGAINRLLA